MPKPIRYIGIIPLLTGCIFSYGQGIRFQFYRTKACTVVEKLDTNYALWPLSNIDTSYFPKAGTVYLPAPGRYRIYAEGPPIDTVFDLSDTGLYIFRFKEPDHGLYNTHGVDVPLLFSSCDSILEGYHEYHYPNQTLEMRGTFREGEPKDSLVTFYQNGKVKMRMLRPPKIITITAFDSIGHVTDITHVEHKSFMEYREYDVKQFYPDGKIKKIESSKKRLVRISSFYPNGMPKIEQTGKNRTEYYVSGIKRLTYNWKLKTDHYTKIKSFTISKTDYDTTGRALQKTVCGEDILSDLIPPQPNLSIKRSDWIISVEKYDRGKITFSVKDMDTKDYLEKYPLEDEDDDDDAP